MNAFHSGPFVSGNLRDLHLRRPHRPCLPRRRSHGLQTRSRHRAKVIRHLRSPPSPRMPAITSPRSPPSARTITIATLVITSVASHECAHSPVITSLSAHEGDRICRDRLPRSAWSTLQTRDHLRARPRGSRRACHSSKSMSPSSSPNSGGSSRSSTVLFRVRRSIGKQASATSAPLARSISI